MRLALSAECSSGGFSPGRGGYWWFATQELFECHAHAVREVAREQAVDALVVLAVFGSLALTASSDHGIRHLDHHVDGSAS